MAKKAVDGEENLSKLDQFKADVSKLFGKGTMVGANEEVPIGDIIPLTSYTLCNAIGKGGLPKNKIVEIIGWESSGKSSLCYDAIANAQKKFNDRCLLIDKENSFDKFYALALGVNLETLDIAFPNSLEDNYALIDKALDSKLYGLIITDSLTSFQPQASLDNPGGAMGKEARINSDRLRMVNDKIRNSNCCIVFINQIREKIGVMFGCLHADMPIIFTDGRSIPIREVVEKQIKGDVWCLNEKTQQIEIQPIVDWHYNGDVTKNEDYIHIETESINGGGKFGITVTPNHKVLTNNGWVEAKNLKINDSLISKYESILVNKNTEDFLKGCLVGDSTITIRSKNTASLKFQDSNNQDYCNWKKDILSNCLSFKENGKKWESEHTYEFAKLKKEIENRNPLKIFKDGIISDLSLAIWIMDDGHYKQSHNNYQLSVKRFKNNKLILDGIKEIFSNSGIKCNYQLSNGNFHFDVKNSEIVANRIAPYLYSSMEYKLPVNLINSDKINLGITGGKIIKMDTVTVLFKRIASDKQMRQKGKYDISIKDNHNYFSGGYRNGVLVHNSPETTSGGNALKFYAHLRIMIRRKEIDAEGQCNTMHFKIIKNKLAPPMKEALTTIVWGKGFDRNSEMIDLAIEFDILGKRGKKVTYGDIVFEMTDKNKIEEFHAYLEDNIEMKDEIYAKVIDQLKAQGLTNE